MKSYRVTCRRLPKKMGDEMFVQKIVVATSVQDALDQIRFRMPAYTIDSIELLGDVLE